MDDLPSTTRGTTIIAERVLSSLVENAIRDLPGIITRDRFPRHGYPYVDASTLPDGHSVTLEIFLAVTWPAPTTTIIRRVEELAVRVLKTHTHRTVTQSTIVVDEIIPSDRVEATQIVAFDISDPRSICSPPTRTVRTITSTPRPLHVRTPHTPQPMRVKKIFPPAARTVRTIDVVQRKYAPFCPPSPAPPHVVHSFRVEHPQQRIRTSFPIKPLRKRL